MNSYTIRRLQAGDLQHGFFETLAGLTTVGEVNLEKARRVYEEITRAKIFGNPIYNTFVAVADSSKVIGTGTLIVEQKFIRSLGKVGRIEDLVVRPECQNKGIGTAIMRRLEYEAERRGCYKVVPTTRSSNIAQWYESIGYRIHGSELRKELPSN